MLWNCTCTIKLMMRKICKFSIHTECKLLPFCISVSSVTNLLPSIFSCLALNLPLETKKDEYTIAFIQLSLDHFKKISNLMNSPILMSFSWFSRSKSSCITTWTFACVQMEPNIFFEPKLWAMTRCNG